MIITLRGWVGSLEKRKPQWKHDKITWLHIDILILSCIRILPSDSDLQLKLDSNRLEEVAMTLMSCICFRA